MNTFIDIAISSTFMCLDLILWHRRGGKHPLPPGPPADPFIGHFRMFPRYDLYKVFMEWAKTHCVIYFGRNTIILNSMEAVNDLLDERSATYSCRQQTIVTFSQIRVASESSNTSIIERVTRIARSSYIVNGLLDTGADNHDETLTRFATSILVKVAFGYDITSNDDPFLAILARFIKAVDTDALSGVTTIDALPLCENLLLPILETYYANWARNVIKPLSVQMHEYPISVLKQHIAEGNSDACILSTELQKSFDSDPEHLHDIKGVAVAMYLAGAGTHDRDILFGHGSHPECQRRCQEELDRVIGSDRLPEFKDRKSLPYLECVLQETLRWNPIVPLGVPHRSTDDDIYKGIFILKTRGSFPIFMDITMLCDLELIPLSYNWDSDFDVDAFKHAIDQFDLKEATSFTENMEDCDNGPLDSASGIAKITRVKYADSDFVEHMNGLILAGLEESGIQRHSEVLPLTVLPQGEHDESEYPSSGASTGFSTGK
ncbi:cytochrome P450 [Mycena floridula]|nr:cytochrome P450 [Mycena floridula]